MKILISTLLAVSTALTGLAVPLVANAQAAQITMSDGNGPRHEGPGPNDHRPDHRPDNGRDDHRPPPQHHHRNNDALTRGIIGGLGAAIIGGAIYEDNNGPRYAPPPPRYPPPRYPPPRYPPPEYGGSQTVIINNATMSRQDWINYCSARYRTFNPDTGTYLGNDGNWYYCSVR